VRASIPRLLGLLVVIATPIAGGEPPRFELSSGDRIVLVGDTLIERDQRYGYLEAMLTLLNPDKDLTFRNLGWSGDTVAGLSRAGFDPPEAGYRQLIEQVLAAKPTVLIVGYGMADSFDGEAGRPRFVAGLNRFLDAVATTKARVVVLTPIAHARQGGSLPDPSPHLAMLERYSRSIAEVAQSRGAWFIDLFEPTRAREARAEITDDGVHLNEVGYRFLAVQIIRGLDPSATREAPRVELSADGTVGPGRGVKVDRVQRSATGVRLRLTRETLAVLGDEGDRPPTDSALFLKVAGLPTGRHELRIDGRPDETRSAESWARGARIAGVADRAQAEQLRAAINQKNRLFFHRWRPQNITYLFGFRKHEQGNNAVEIPRFDPLVAEQEREIARLRKPVAREYEWIPADGQAGR
jgi:lysophospholipase L1-like esterase